MNTSRSWFLEELDRRGVSRRDFMGFCGVMASALALPKSVGARIAAADPEERKAGPRLARVPGLRRQHRVVSPRQPPDRRRNRPRHALASTTTRRSWRPPAQQAEDNLARAVKDHKGKYIAVVEGSIPTGADGAYCTIGGRSALQIAREVCGERRGHDRHRHVRGLSAASRRLRRTRRARSASPTPCRASRT